MNDFDGKIALVTGTTGIGLATARRLAAGGAAIIACGIDRAANAALTAELDSSGAGALVMAVDVSVPDQVRDAVAAGVERFGGLDIIVNSAAIHPYGTAVSTDFDTWNQAMSVNVGSIYLTAHFGIPEMIRRGSGAIVNVASVQGFACQQNVAAYATTKGAIHTLTRSLALDYARSGIRVNSVSPGSIRTPILEKGRAARTAPMPMSRPPTGASAKPTPSDASASRRKWRNSSPFCVRRRPGSAPARTTGSMAA